MNATNAHDDRSPPDDAPGSDEDAAAPDAVDDATRLQEAEHERDQLQDKWLRAVAELDNFRKRSRRAARSRRRRPATTQPGRAYAES